VAQVPGADDQVRSSLGAQREKGDVRGDYSDTLLDKGPDNGDRDSLILAPRKPTPTLNADAVAIPEPDSN
jgi:hypothetical protein